MKWYEKEETPEYEENKYDYTKSQMEAMADDLLKADVKSELCRECGERGSETGEILSKHQDALDGQGHQLVLDFPELACKNKHAWCMGEGKLRGIDGKDPILFEDHLMSRKKREIMCANGTPDPEIVSGSYNRTHPLGRKVNDQNARSRHGASFYR